MRIGRTLPPTAAPLPWRNILSAIFCIDKKESLNRMAASLLEYYHTNHCFLLSSGTAALTLLLQAVRDIRPQREKVIIPAFTCYSVAAAVIRAGCRIQLCDVDPATLDFDPDKLRRQADNSNILAVIPVHLFGLPADLPWIKRIFNSTGGYILEDAAQAMGVEYQNSKIATLAEASFFSLGRGKQFSTAQGGIILTQDKLLAEALDNRFKQLPHYSPGQVFNLVFQALALRILQHPYFFWLPSLIPWLHLGETLYDPAIRLQKMSGFQAGLAADWQKILKRLQNVREQNCAFWMDLFSNAAYREAGILNIDFINYKHNNQNSIKNNKRKTYLPLLRYPLRITNHGLRESLLLQSRKQGLGIMPAYPGSINKIPQIREQFKHKRFPGAQECAQSFITLPTHPYLKYFDKQKIIILFQQLTGI